MSDDPVVKVEDKSPQKSETEDAKSDSDMWGEPADQQEEEPPPIPEKAAEEEKAAEKNEDSTAVKRAEETPLSNETEAAPAPPSPAPRPADPRISVPRKAPSTSDPRSPSSTTSFHGTTTSDNGASTRPGYPGTSVGLPEGISVPMGVDSKLLQGRLLDTLKQLPTDLITDALNEYDDALQNKGGSIRNQGAYLYGVIKRYVNVQERAASGNADHVMGKELTPTVTVRKKYLLVT